MSEDKACKNVEEELRQSINELFNGSFGNKIES